ncbi:MAG: tetratricopeptide repeat protein [Chlorobi bacterium]|nr:tetratricopeptide repeat protein [Chlorobiota bacterium]
MLKPAKIVSYAILPLFLFSETLFGQEKGKITAFLEKADFFRSQFKYDSAIMFYDSAILLSGEDQKTALTAYAYCMKGRSYRYSHKNDSARVYIDRSIQLAGLLDNDTMLAIAYINLANILKSSGQTDSAGKCYKESLRLFEQAGDSTGIGKSYNALAIFYKNTGDFDKELKSALKANYIFKKLNKPAPYIRSLINLGNAYEKLKEIDTALSCYEDAYKMSTENNKPKMAVSALINRGVIYYRLGKKEKDKQKARQWVEKAKNEFQRAIDFSERIDDKRSLAMLYSNISILYGYLGQEKEFLRSAEKAVAISRELNDLTNLIGALNNLGLAYKKTGDYRKAESCYLESFQIAKRTNQKETVKKTSDNLSSVYELEGNYKNALKYSRLAAAYQDSLFNEKKQKLIEEHKTHYEILRLKDLNRIKELDKKRIRAERNVTLWVSVFMVVILLGLLIFFRMRARKNRIIAEQKIRKLEDEKKLMAAQAVLVGQEKERERIARELHDGIGILLSTASIHFSSVESKADKETSEMLKKANKLLKEASKEVRQISHNMMPGVLSKFGLMEALEDMFEKVQDAGEVQVDLRLEIGEERLPENMEIMLYRVIQEMLNNTLKHAKASKIRFSLIKENDEIRMEYADDGVGFDEAELPHDKNLGLAGIRSRVEYLGGAVELRSGKGKGIMYFITIPLYKRNA